MSIRICFYEDEYFKQFLPLSYLRPVYCLRAGIMPLFRRAERYFDKPEICLAARHGLAGVISSEHSDYPVNIIKRQEGQAVLFLNGRLRSYGNLPQTLQGLRQISKLTDRSGQVVGVFFPSDQLTNISGVAAPEQYFDEFKRNDSDVVDVETEASLYDGCWEIIADLDTEIAADFTFLQSVLDKHDDAKVHTGSYIIKREQVYLGRGVEVLPGSQFDASKGPIFIGDNTRIEAHVAIYGPCFIGANSQVLAGKITGSSIGHTSRAGGEIEESVFQSYVNKYHAGFIGHSYVGSWVNFGAMTTNSDLKNNYSVIKVSVEGKMVDTGSIKVGSFIGDHTKFGIGTLLNTGISIGVCCNLYGGTLLTDHEVPSFSWGDTGRYETYRFEKAIETMRRTAERRKVTLSRDEEKVLKALSDGQVTETGVIRF